MAYAKLPEGFFCLSASQEGRIRAFADMEWDHEFTGVLKVTYFGCQYHEYLTLTFTGWGGGGGNVRCEFSAANGIDVEHFPMKVIEWFPVEGSKRNWVWTREELLDSLVGKEDHGN